MSRMYDACFKGQWALVNQLLDQGSSVHFQHPENGMKTLSVAVAKKAPIGIIRRLVKEGGANPYLGDNKGFTPLHAAFEYNASFEIIDYLLSVGANPNQPSEDGATAMHFAAQYKVPISKLRALIKAGGDVNATKNNGATPLITATENSASAVFVRTLLEAGANSDVRIFNERRDSFDTALSLAKRKCTADVVAVLQEHATERDSGKSPRHVRNVSVKVEMARLLFREAVTSNSLLTASVTCDAEDDNMLSLQKGERVTILHGSLEEGLHSPYEDYLLVCNNDGEAGMALRSSLHDHASSRSV